MKDLNNTNSDYIPLIFPLVFSASNFIDLDEYTSTEKKKLFDLIHEKTTKENSVKNEIAKAYLDLNELIDNQNCKGYRYNSYLLQMAILKLEYSRAMIIRLEPENYSTIYSVLSSVCFYLRAMLREKWTEYKGNFVSA